MRERNRLLHSILIVSCSGQFDAAVKKSLQAKEFMSMDFCSNAAAARQRFFERYYDIVLVNFPLPDETGLDFACDLVENGNVSVMIAAPIEVFDEVLEGVSDYGILVISKPVQNRQIEKAVRLLGAIQDRIHSLEQEIMAAHEKMEEMRIVSKAKFALVENRHMTEEEAHRFIGKEAMNNGVTRKRIAQKILEDFE